MTVGLFVVTAPTEADLHFLEEEDLVQGWLMAAGYGNGSRGIHGGDDSGSIYGTGRLIGHGIVASQPSYQQIVVGHKMRLHHPFERYC